MKLGKIILPALLAIGAVSGFAFAKQAEEKQLAPTAAMSSYLCDEDIDVGINVQRTTYQADTWETDQFYINSFESTDVSGGDYLAIRIRSNNGGASYFDFIPNVGGNPHRITLVSGVGVNPGGVKFIPAVAGNAGVAEDYNGGRGWDLPMNLWADCDIWLCIPKTTFTRNYWNTGKSIDWENDGLWAVYFMFYGVTCDNTNFDIGNIWTANIDDDGHLVKVNRLLNWATVASGTATIDTGDGSMAKLNITRNNANLIPAVDFINKIEHVDACNVSESTTAYNNLNASYNNLTSVQKFYLDEYQIYDYADGDLGHTGGRGVAYSASAKWAQICATAGHVSSARILFNKKNDSIVLTVALTSTLVLLSVAGAYFIIRRRKLQK